MTIARKNLTEIGGYYACYNYASSGFMVANKKSLIPKGYVILYTTKHSGLAMYLIRAFTFAFRAAILGYFRADIGYTKKPYLDKDPLKFRDWNPDDWRKTNYVICDNKTLAEFIIDYDFIYDNYIRVTFLKNGKRKITFNFQINKAYTINEINTRNGIFDFSLFEETTETRTAFRNNVVTFKEKARY